MTDTRFLIVDDAPEIRRLVEEVIKLRDQGWRVVADARDGREGVEQARAAQPDIVLLDISMPVMDGLEALPLVREAAPTAIVVILTGFPSTAARDIAIEAGAHGFMEKDELVDKLVPQLEAIISALRPAVSETARTGP